MAERRTTVEQDALVTLALANCELRKKYRDLQYEHRHAAEKQYDALLRARLHVQVIRESRPYEGSLWRELRHAIHRWKSMRRKLRDK